MQFTIKLPAYNFRALIREIVQTAILSGAAAGLTVAANQTPAVADHYGLGAVATAQLVMIIGSIRALISSFNSVKVDAGTTGTTGTTPTIP